MKWPSANATLHIHLSRGWLKTAESEWHTDTVTHRTIATIQNEFIKKDPNRLSFLLYTIRLTNTLYEWKYAVPRSSIQMTIYLSIHPIDCLFEREIRPIQKGKANLFYNINGRKKLWKREKTYNLISVWSIERATNKFLFDITRERYKSGFSGRKLQTIALHT